MNDSVKNTSVEIRLAGGHLPVNEVALMNVGTIIEMDSSADGDVCVFAGGKFIASGRALVIGGNFAVRLDEVCR